MIMSIRSLGLIGVIFAVVFAQPIPTLPFPDNPDPSLCGIPTVWGKPDPAWLDGHYRGKLYEPEVFLYESHYRQRILGKAKSGTQVQIKLFQANPKLNYYFVRTLGLKKNLEGWVPAPFVRLDRVSHNHFPR